VDQHKADYLQQI